WDVPGAGRLASLLNGCSPPSTLRLGNNRRRCSLFPRSMGEETISGKAKLGGRKRSGAARSRFRRQDAPPEEEVFDVDGVGTHAAAGRRALGSGRAGGRSGRRGRVGSKCG